MSMETAEEIGHAPLPRRMRRRVAARDDLHDRPVLVVLFLLSLMTPVIFDLGPFRLAPHRVFLLVTFLPMLAMLLAGRAGRLILADYLMIGAAGWAALAFLVSAPGTQGVEAAGIHVVEVFGAYMVARLGIRTAAGFRRFVKVFLLAVLALIPFAAIESITGRAVLLDWLPMSVREQGAGGKRLGLDRAQVAFSHPILYGAFVSTALGMAWYAYNPRSGFLARAVRAGIVAVATFFSLSAGALLAYLMQAGMIAWDVVMRSFANRWRALIWLVILAYVVLDILSNRTPFHLVVDYATFSEGAAYYRILIFRHGIGNVWENPLFGLGTNISEWDRAFWMHASIDNFWLHHAMAFGLPAFAFLVGAVVAMLRRIARTRLAAEEDRACRTGYVVSFVGLALAGGTVHYWTAMMAFFMFMLGAGLWLATGGAETTEPDRASGRRRLRSGPRLRRGAEPAATAAGENGPPPAEAAAAAPPVRRAAALRAPHPRRQRR